MSEDVELLVEVEQLRCVEDNKKSEFVSHSSLEHRS